MRIVALSDTFAKHYQIVVPEGDILIHAGNITREGLLAEVTIFNRWLGTLPHKHKIVIAGNHDHCFQRNGDFQRKGDEAREVLNNGIYLEDQAIVIDGVKFYGSPWQPRFHNLAFNLDRGAQIAAIWAVIPDNTDVLITHGPPFGHGDLTRAGHFVGCQELMNKVEEIKPRVHIFGLVKEDTGISFNAKTTFINAAICDDYFRTVNKPQIFDLEKER